jgi:hypothetical protein
VLIRSQENRSEDDDDADEKVLMRDKPLGVIEKDCLCKILEFASCCSLN